MENHPHILPFTRFAISLIAFALAAESTRAASIDGSRNVIEEIVVTASKREESLQDSANAVSAFSANEIQIKGIDTPEDLQYYTPGLTIGKTAIGQAQVTMRGVGAENLAPGGDPGVPIHVDGHYLQSSSFALRDMHDIERIEVLRGPQGTLYGRNATGGAINIITRDPTDTFEGGLALDVGNYDKYLIQAVVSGPLGDRLRGRLTYSNEQRDGFVRNPIHDDDYQDANYYSVRGKLEIDVAENLLVTLGAYQYEDESQIRIQRVKGPFPDGPFFATGAPNPYFGKTPNVSASNPRIVNADSRPTLGDNAEGGSMEVVWSRENWELVSLTAYNTTYNRTKDGEIDGSHEVFTSLDTEIAIETWSQELRAQGDAGKLEWIGGIFYYEEESLFDFGLTFYEQFVTPPVNFLIKSDVESESLGLFARVDYQLTENTKGWLGVRQSMDDKAVDSALTISVFGTVVVAGTNVADDDWSKLTSEVGLEHSLTDDVLIYGKFSTGYKAGGFNATSLQGSSYDPEEVKAVEAGIKSRLLDGRLQLNLATFHYDYKDKQEYQIEQVASVLTNASAATVYGAELEVQAVLAAGLRLEGSITALKSEYDEFDTVDPNNPQLGLQDLSGNQLTRTPELKAFVGARYRFNTGFGPMTAHVSYSWQDELFYRPYNTDLDRVGSQGRSNARLTWSSADAAWTVDAYVNNIDDGDDISNQVVASPGLGGIVTAEYLPPRTYGVKVRYDFGK